ncbi:MAG TPA: PQQ-binding-like beta-propeller repeat protein [Candidatus Nanoarchaeia archaeon]|nr:PQQ-binding-like beta-propeller repeat protein [Candidatus Nanoarchaeia archaeon]
MILSIVSAAEHTWPLISGNLRHTGLSPYDTSNINGAIKWTFDTNDGIESSPTIAEDGTVYFGSHDGYLYALNPDGTLKWKYKPAEPVYDERWKHYSAIISSPAIAKDGTVFIIAPDDFLHAVKEGKERWRFPLKWNGIDFWSSAVIGADGTIYVGSARTDDDSQLVAGFYAINQDGKEKWHYEIDAGVPSSPAIGKDGSIYVGGNIMKKVGSSATTEGYLFAFKPDGTLKWKFKTQDWLESSPSIAEDGTLYTGSKEGRIYALDAEGTKKWEYATGDGISGTPAIAKDGTLFIGSWDNNMYALLPDGKLKWKVQVEEGFESLGASAVIGADGTIYFGSSRGFLYAYNPDGTEKWRLSNLGSVASTPAIGKDGMLYFGAWNKKFYAVGKGDAPKIKEGEGQLECHEKQLKREVEFDKNPINTCIDGKCDSYEMKCQRKGQNGKCYAPIEVCVSKSCKKYRSYCNLIIKNTEPGRGFTTMFNENYVTADGKKQFIKEMKAFLDIGQERSIVWQYEVDANNAGQCDYSDLRNPICEKKEEEVTWNFTTERSDVQGGDKAPPQECMVGGKFIGEDRCRALFDKGRDAPPEKCLVDGKFIGEEKCRALMDVKSEGPKKDCAGQCGNKDQSIVKKIISWFLSIF